MPAHRSHRPRERRPARARSNARAHANRCFADVLHRATRSAMMCPEKKLSPAPVWRPGRAGLANAIYASHREGRCDMPNGITSQHLVKHSVYRRAQAASRAALRPFLLPWRRSPRMWSPPPHNGSITPQAFCTWRSQANGILGNTGGESEIRLHIAGANWGNTGAQLLSGRIQPRERMAV